MTMQSLCAFVLAVSAVACSSSSAGPGVESTDADTDSTDSTDSACTYPPPHNDPRCDSVVYGASCDGTFSCTWPGYGDCPAVGCCAPKVCICNIRPDSDAGPDGGSRTGGWTCMQ